MSLQRANTLSAAGHLPPVPEAALQGLLRNMTKDQLDSLLKDDERQQEIINDLSDVKNVEQHRAMLLTANRSLAEYNLSLSSTFRGAKEDLVQKHRQAAELVEELKTIRAQIDSLASGTSLDTTLALLQTKAAEAEEETEEMAEKFLSGETPVSQFMEQYVKSRKEAHVKRIKSDKMSELLRRGQGGGGRSQAPYPTGNTPYGMPGFPAR